MKTSNEAEKTFRCFPDLFPELRSKIWRYTPALFPRIIEVRPRTTPTEAWDPLTTKHHVRVTAPIALLQINHEARELLMPLYTLLSSDVTLTQISNHHLASPNPHEKPPMVNLDTDTIYFSIAWGTTEEVPYLSFIQRLFQNFDQDKQRVRRLAVDNSSRLSNLIDYPFNLRYFDDIWGASESCSLNMNSALLEFKNLDELVIVVERTHLRADVVLVCFMNLGNASIGRGEEYIDILRALGTEGWKIPQISICTTHVVPVNNRKMESQRAYLERVYGKAFVSLLTRE